MAKISFQGKIFWYIKTVIIIMGALIILVEGLHISKTVFQEARNGVAMDLRVAHNFFDKELEKMVVTLSLLAENQLVKDYFGKDGHLSFQPKSWFEKRRISSGFDVLSLCDKEGNVILRTRPPYQTGDSRLTNPLVLEALQGRKASGMVIIPSQALSVEGENLAEQARIHFVPTPHAKPRSEKAEDSGMFLMAAVPVGEQDGTMVGVLYGGILLNRNCQLVDYIGDMVFEEREYRGKPFGTVTVFQGDVRIATNVENENGSRAIGTRVSSEVYQKVVKLGGRWLGRAFVVNNWYISAYQPIYDPTGGVIGMLYVGVLEDKYLDIRNRVFLSFLAIILGGVGAVLILSYFLSRGLSQPIGRLVRATNRIANGEVHYILRREKKYPRVHKLPYVEIQELTQNFNQMVAALHMRETKLRKANSDLRQINKNYIETLGFVTHEIKNRLAIILGSAYNLKQGVVGRLNEMQARMVDILLRNSERLCEMIKNYLDLSRIEEGELRVNKKKVNFKKDILDPVIDEFKGQFETSGILLEAEIADHFEILADPDLLKIVMENLLSNAIKYGKQNGTVRIEVQRENQKSRINTWNEGRGIPEDEIDRLFSKFTRLKGEELRKERGSGLGLFVTREIVRKHGGKIWVESEEDKWANFIFTLPLN